MPQNNVLFTKSIFLIRLDYQEFCSMIHAKQREAEKSS